MTPTPQERTELQRLAEQATNTELPTPWYDAPSIQQALDDYFGASAAPCNKSDAAYIAAANPAAILDLLSLAAQFEELRAENERIRLYPDEEEIIRERDSALAALEKEREENERLKDGIKIEQETRRAALTSYNFIEQNQVKLESHYTALEKAAQAVVWFDWSSNDDDAVSAITALRDALGALLDSEASQGGSDG